MKQTNNMSTTTDINLFEEIKSGNRVSYETMFKQHYSPLVRFAKEFVKDLDAAEDLVQEVFVKIWERKGSIQISSSIKAYLYMAVRNHCLNQLKAEAKQTFMEDSLNNDIRLSTNSTENLSVSNELEQHIKQAIEKLPPRCALIFKLSRFEHKSYKEIAEILDLSVKTVENQMVKALQIMRTNLAPYLCVIIFLFFYYTT